MRAVLAAALALSALGVSSVLGLEPSNPVPSVPEVRAAVGRALPLIRKGRAGHLTQRTCFACHHQAVPILAITTARGRGLAAEEQVPKHARFIAQFLDRNRSNYLKGKGQGGQVDTAGYALWALEMAGWKADATTEAVAEYLLMHDKDLGHWRGTSNRPPSEASPFTTTYVAVRGLADLRHRRAEGSRVEQPPAATRAWLAKTPARDTEDRVFRLWGLERVGGAARETKAAAQELIKTQRFDGGWGQLDGMATDAYATGTALVALHQAGGLAVDDAVYRRGVKYLLATQREDGSWHVRSRSKPFQVYFESGFPHGKDQFISLAATSWATTSLALALPAAERPDSGGKVNRAAAKRGIVN